MAKKPIFDDAHPESPDDVTPAAEEEQVFPETPVTPLDANEADVLEQAHEVPVDEEEVPR